MFVRVLCIEKKLIHENKELFKEYDSNKTILSCDNSIYDQSDVSDIAYVLNIANEIVAYLDELKERHIKIKHAVLIHSDENVLKQASQAGLYTIGIGVNSSSTSISYDSVEEMLNAANIDHQRKQKKQNIFIIIAVVLFLGSVMLQNIPHLFSIGVIASMMALIIALGVYPEKSFWKVISFFLDGIM